MKSLLLVVIISAFAVSCNKSSNDQFNLAQPPLGIPSGGNDGGGGIQQQDLKGLTYSQVMNLKYESAVLVCQLWTMLSSDLDLQRFPNAEHRIDLKTLLEPRPFQFRMYGYVRGLGDNPYRIAHEVEVSINVHKIAIRDFFGISVPETGARYNFMHSPEIVFSTYAQVKSWTPNGTVKDSFYKPEAQIHEKIPTEVLRYESDIVPNDFGLKTRDYVKCVIETDIKSGYEQQFTVEAPIPSVDSSDIR